MDQEHEIPEFLRSAVKDAETEKQLRELHEKAYGLDAIKPKFQETREKFKEVTQRYENLNKTVQSTIQKRDRGDIWGVIQDLQIPKEKVYQAVLDQLNYQQLPPEQQREQDTRKAQEQRSIQLEQQNQYLQQAYQQQAVQARTVELSSVVSRAEVKSFNDQFDAMAGQPGAFENEVIKLGKQMALERGVDLTAEQAVKMVMDHYGRFIKAAPSATPAETMSAPESQATQVPANPVQKPVIPAVNGRSTSPAKRVPKSLDDLRKLASQL